MDTSLLPVLLGLATLLPLASFFTLLIGGRKMRPAAGGYVAAGAIVSAGLLSLLSLALWLAGSGEGAHEATSTEGGHGPGTRAAVVPGVLEPVTLARHAPATEKRDAASSTPPAPADAASASGDEGEVSPSHAKSAASHGHGASQLPPVTGDYYLLGQFGRLRLTISYYIDSLTLVMFCLVTVIASCIHFYAMGYMHEEQHEVTDHQVVLRGERHLKRRGRYASFFQYMSLFCFSMLGLVLAGNLAMVFVFWELVGICSYFLIGFYVERKSASNAANKAFIVNRVGDFGMLIGMMALWTGLGTFAFGDIDANRDNVIETSELGIFSQVRPAGDDHRLVAPPGLALTAARGSFERWAAGHPSAEAGEVRAEVDALSYWMLIVAGIGIFCGCVGKSAQFPLHVWLPDAMEGPTPVSALVHSATMVAAGVYLVGRFYPVFAPEVLLVIAVIGVITLFMAATIAITATDIKRVLAYSTVSQLGYMMLALGLGGWLAGMMHLVTHAFFKSLLFLCSGSVIHAVHTNEMTEMGGLRKKMPVTAFTMLVGCLAISGISIPFLIGFSGYYSKDMILEQAFAFMREPGNGSFPGSLFFAAGAGGAAITAFYMFRLWFMTFAGLPRNMSRYEHAHESPKVMVVPLVILAVFATCAAWKLPWGAPSLQGLLEQACPVGTGSGTTGKLVSLTWPDQNAVHEPGNFRSIVVPVTLVATATAWAGIALAMAMYLFRTVNPHEVRQQFSSIYRFLWHKWWFDELYQRLFVRPTHALAGLFARVDRRVIDGFVDALARFTERFARVWERVSDRMIVDRLLDALARRTYRTGVLLRSLQTGVLRQYVMYLIVGVIALFIFISLFWIPASGN